MDPPVEADMELEDEAPVAEPSELVLEGNGQLSFGVGGKRPTTATVRLVGGKIDLAGLQYEKGQTLTLRVECIVGEVAFVDTHDSATGQVVGTERRHKARITGVDHL